MGKKEEKQKGKGIRKKDKKNNAEKKGREKI